MTEPKAVFETSTQQQTTGAILNQANYPSWRLATLLTLLSISVIFFLYQATWLSIITVWNSSETFAHGYIILPISVWLIFQQRAALARLNPSPAWLGLIGLASAAMLWLLADLGGIQVVTQYAFVAMLILVILSLLGWAVTRQILFPLLFLLFAVPFGDAFIDPLIQYTANFTVFALQLTGIPVFREGNSFSIPSGSWSVVTACSGVRYLIASFTLGCLYAYLTYRSTWRRALFILASIVIPIIANGIRAYMIVMIGHLFGMKYAVGIDHLIYGWLLFGFVMLVLFWVGSFWREDIHPEPMATGQIAVDSPPTQPRVLVAAMIAVLMVAAAGWGYSQLISRFAVAQPPVALTAPRVDAWNELPAAFTNWRPQYHQPAAEIVRFYTRQGQQVGVYIAYYRNQHKGAELITYLNVLAMREGKDWKRLDESAYQLHAGKYTIAARQSLLGGGDERLLALHWYWVSSQFTANTYLVKTLQARDSLLLRGDDGAVVVIFTPLGEKQHLAMAALTEFARDALPAIEQILHQAHAK